MKKKMTPNFHVYDGNIRRLSFITKRDAIKFIESSRLNQPRLKYKDEWLHPEITPTSRDNFLGPNEKVINMPLAPVENVQGVPLSDLKGPFVLANDNGFNRGIVFMPTLEHRYMVDATGNKVWGRVCFTLITSLPGPQVGDDFLINVEALVIPVKVARV